MFDIMNDTTPFFILLVLIGIGIIWSGLWERRLVRKIQNVPTSKIDSAHIGDFVEIKGEVFSEDENLVISPVGGTVCTCFIWEIEKSFLRDDFEQWLPIEKIYSNEFLLISDKGKYLAAIKLRDAELLENVIGSRTEFKINEVQKLTIETQNYLKKKSKIFKEIASNGKGVRGEQYRIKERTFVKGVELYIIGATFQSTESELSRGNFLSQRSVEETKKETGQIYKEALKDHDVLTKYDRDKNGELDSKERKKVHEDIERKQNKKHKVKSIIEYNERIKFIYKKSKNERNFLGVQLVQVSKQKVDILLKRKKGQARSAFILGISLTSYAIWKIFEKMTN